MLFDMISLILKFHSTHIAVIRYHIIHNCNYSCTIIINLFFFPRKMENCKIEVSRYVKSKFRLNFCCSKKHYQASSHSKNCIFNPFHDVLRYLQTCHICRYRYFIKWSWIKNTLFMMRSDNEVGLIEPALFASAERRSGLHSILLSC